MIRRDLYIVILSFLFSVGLSAQQLTVKGIVKDQTTKKGLESVTVRLLNPDSTLLEGDVTDRHGKFELKRGYRGDMLIVFSYVGYESNVIRIENMQKSIDVGEILMDEISENIGDLIVSAERTINKSDRQIIFPSTLQQKMSFSAFELLGKMRLPGLEVNTMQNTISSLNNGSVQLRINGVRSTIQDVLAILSKQVVKVEYIDMPGIRYGEGVSAVVDFITRRAEEGISGGTTMNNAVSTGYGNDNFYLKYNNKDSEFSLNYDLSYRDFDNKHTDIYQKLQLKDGSVRLLEKEGLKSPYESRQRNLVLSYNMTKTSDQVLNMKFSNSWQNDPLQNIVQYIRETNKPDLNVNTSTKEKSYKPVLDIYYQKDFTKGNTLMANLVGTYTSTDYTRNYAEYLTDNTLNGNRYDYTVDGSKYSLIAELVHIKYFNQNTSLSTGINYDQSYLENIYNGTATGSVSTTMDNSNLYVFTQLSGSLKKLGYNMGIGLSRKYFNESSHKYTFYTLRPKLSLSYSIVKGLFLQYTFSINPMLPELAKISDISQWLDEYEVMVGNPELKPYRAYINNLSLRYSLGRFTAMLVGYYQRNPKPIMSDIVKRIDNPADDGYYFQYGYANQKRFEHLQGRIYLQYHAIENILDFSGYAGVNHYNNKGNEYAHSYTGYFGAVSMDASYKKFSLSASVRSGITSFFGITKRRFQSSADIALACRLKENLRIGVGVQNPFMSKGERNWQEMISDVMTKRTTNYTKDLGNMAYLTFSWNFSVGKKHNSAGARLFNQDYDTGVVK